MPALWDMLNGPELVDLEELTYGAIPYTPLFLAFMNDHFQVSGMLGKMFNTLVCEQSSGKSLQIVNNFPSVSMQRVPYSHAYMYVAIIMHGLV